MIPSIDIKTFVENSFSGEYCIIDVRSPSEFSHSHFPGAFNIPLLNDEERRIVGITYKEKGKQEAIRTGFSLTGGKFSTYIDEATRVSSGKKIMLYCWRGGLRSNVMGWVLQLSGLNVTVLDGGYKKFRNWVLDQLTAKKNVWIVAGRTGAGKSEILNSLKQSGEQVIDLEKLANHRGSTFGALGQPPQPSMEHFENKLALEWSVIDENKPVWVEDESRWIGKVKIADDVYNQMVHNHQFIFIDSAVEERKKRILKEYASFPLEALTERTAMLARRLGGQRLKEALQYLSEKNFDDWANVMLDYYDHTYAHSNARRKISTREIISTADNSPEQIVKRLIAISREVIALEN